MGCKVGRWRSAQKYTGKDNQIILDNLRYVNQRGKDIYLRCPIITGINDNDEHFAGLMDLEKQLESVKESISCLFTDWELLDITRSVWLPLTKAWRMFRERTSWKNDRPLSTMDLLRRSLAESLRKQGFTI